MSCNARLKLVRDTLALLQEESLLFASQEEALYFRTTTKKKTAAIIEKPVHREPAISPSTLSTTAKSLLPVEEETPKIFEPSTKPQAIPSEPKEPTVSPWRNDTQIPVDPMNFGALRALFQKAFPHIAVINEIPNDTTAKKIATRWKTKNQIAPISILHFSEPPPQKKLLVEIVKAIDIYFGPAKLIDAEAIEKEKQWETFLASGDLKLVISCDYTLWQLTDLMRFYKEIPSQQTRTLGNVPLFLLPDLSLYLKDPLLKRSLWKSLCTRIS